MQRILLGLLLSSTFLAQAAKPIATAMETHLNRFVHDDLQALNTTPVPGQPATLPAETLSELKKREIVVNLFFNNSYSRLNQASCSEIFSDNFISDLNLFTVGDGDATNLFGKLNYTQTLFGETHLIYNLLTPTADRAQLLKHQALVKALVAQPQVMLQLEANLKQIQAKQNAILKLWLEDTADVQSLFYQHKFLKPLNQNAVAQAVLNTGSLLGDWTKAHGGELRDLITNKATRVYLKQEPAELGVWDHTKSVAKDFVMQNVNPVNLVYSPIRHARRELQEAPQALALWQQLFTENGWGYNPRVASGIYHSLLVLNFYTRVMETHGKFKFYQSRYERAKVVNQLQAQLVDISLVVKTVEQMRELCQTELGIELAPVTLSTELQDLIADLHKATFDSPSILYFEGRVLKCYYQLKQLKEQLADLLAQIGYIDAYLSAAKLYSTGGVNGKAEFCFVEYLQQATPTVAGVNYWNVMIDPQVVVANNLVANTNIVLTGANAGGKSTTIKAFMQNLLLGQTFGIAAATKFSFTPFTKLITYLNITDDLANGKSLFKAEVERAQALLAMVYGLAPHEFCFCAIDELFTGTAAEAGEQCAVELVQKLQAKTNANFIFATHYQNLTKLAEQNPARFANYRMLPPTKVNGKLVYPFVIAPGVNTTNVAKDILAEANLINF